MSSPDSMDIKSDDGESYDGKIIAEEEDQVSSPLTSIGNGIDDDDNSTIDTPSRGNTPNQISTPARSTRSAKKSSKQVQTTLDSFTTKSGVVKQSVSIKIKLTPKKLQAIQKSFDDDSSSRKRGRPKGNIAQNEPKLKFFNKRGRPKGSKLQMVIAEPSEPEDLPWVSDDEISNEQPPSDDPDDITSYPGIAFLVMLQARFNSAFQDIPQLGPQDFEIGLKEQPTISLNIEKFMCKLLSLLLNRKKPVEAGRYKGALEELHNQLPTLGLNPYWPKQLRLKNSPDCINELGWKDRLSFLHMLGFWTLTNSEVIRSIINTSGIDGKGKVSNGIGENPDGTPLASKVQYLGTNIDNIRFWLIKGQGDTPFRIYKETNPRLRYVSWKAIVGTCDELEELITNGELAIDVSRQGGKLRDKLKKLLPEFRESDERRSKEQKKELKKQRQIQMIQNARRGEGEYVGRTRTRNKRVNYNIDDLSGVYEEEEYYDSGSSNLRSSRASRGTRRSARFAGDESTPVSYDEDEEVYLKGENGEVVYDDGNEIDKIGYESDDDFNSKPEKDADAGDYEPSEEEEEDDDADMDYGDEARLKGKPLKNIRFKHSSNLPPGSSFVFPVLPAGYVPQGYTGLPPGLPPGVVPIPFPFPMGMVGPNGIPIGPNGMPIGPNGIPLGPNGMPIGPNGMPVGPHGMHIGPHGIPIGPNGMPLFPNGIPIEPTIANANSIKEESVGITSREETTTSSIPLSTDISKSAAPDSTTITNTSATTPTTTPTTTS